MRYALLCCLLLACSKSTPRSAASQSAQGQGLGPLEAVEVAPRPMDAAVVEGKDSDDLSMNQEGTDLAAWVRLADVAGAGIKYAHLKKNADRYKQIPWSFSGRIVEITETESGSFARVSLDAFGNNIIFVVAQFHTDFVEGDSVDVLGMLAGSYSYKSQAGWDIAIPSMLARSIQKRGTLARARRPVRGATR